MLMRHPSYLNTKTYQPSNCSESVDDEHCHQVTPLEISDNYNTTAPPVTKKKTHRSKFANQIGLHLLRDWRFTVFWISTSITYLSHVTLHWFIPDRAIEIGFSQRDAAMTIVVVNVANIFSRLVFGFTSSNKFFNHIILLVMYVFLSGLSSVLVLIWRSYWSYMFFAALFGILRDCTSYTSCWW